MADNRTEYAEFLQRILNGDTSFSLLKQSIPAEKEAFQYAFYDCPAAADLY